MSVSRQKEDVHSAVSTFLEVMSVGVLMDII